MVQSIHAEPFSVTSTIYFVSQCFVLMVFNFTFSFPVPGITNPFAAQPVPPPEPIKAPPLQEKLTRSQVGPRARPDHPSLPAPTPLNKKRGWTPSTAEPSQPEPVKASSSGYLDTPAKYRDMAQSQQGSVYDRREHEDEANDMDRGMCSMTSFISPFTSHLSGIVVDVAPPGRGEECSIRAGRRLAFALGPTVHAPPTCYSPCFSACLPLSAPLRFALPLVLNFYHHCLPYSML